MWYGNASLDLYSLRRLEILLGRSRAELKDLASKATHYYKPFPLRPKERKFARKVEPAKKRWIDNPVDPLKAIQSRIQERLLSPLILPEHLLGGVRGKSITHNALLHLGARYLITIDIKNFFPSITPTQVRSVFRKTLNCSAAASHLLTGLTTCRGRLPQGAPTSPLLANLVLSSFDGKIRSVCRQNGIRYSSWVDDLAFSGDSASQVIGLVVTTLMRAGFRVSHRKIKRMGPGDRKLLNNLVLGKLVTVQKQYRARIRAGIHNLECGKVATGEIGAYVEGLKGNIGHVRLFDLKKATNLERHLKDVCAALGEDNVSCQSTNPVHNEHGRGLRLSALAKDQRPTIEGQSSENRFLDCEDHSQSE
jgi:RNA-directed DNA polymerase